MGSVGIFFGSDTGNTEAVAKMIQKKFGKNLVEVKDIAKSSTEEIAEFTTEFASKNQWSCNHHELRRRSPATRLQLIFRTDHKMTAKFWTVFVETFAPNLWRDFVR